MLTGYRKVDTGVYVVFVVYGKKFHGELPPRRFSGGTIFGGLSQSLPLSWSHV